MLLVNLLRDIGGTLFSSFLNYYKRSKGLQNKITIGYDGFPFLEPLTGVGWYSYNVLKELSKNESLKINLYGKIFHSIEENCFYVTFNGFENLRIRTYGLGNFLLPNRSFWEKLGERFLSSLFICLDKNDFFFSPNFFPPPHFKITASAISTIHDCTFKVYPEFLQKETLENLNRYLPETIYKAEKIISVSKHTKEDLLKFFKIRNSRVKVIYNGFEKLELKEKNIDFMPYLLFVSTIEPRKNVKNIIKAFNILREKGIDFNLVLIGKIGWKSEGVLEEIKKSPYKNFIYHLSYIKREDLGNYYKNAFCLLFPSFYEGFGFPLLEAFSMGCPVITSYNSSLKEIGMDGCLYVETDENSIAEGVFKLYNDKDLREKLIKKGYEISKNFSWKKAAEETLNLFLEGFK